MKSGTALTLTSLFLFLLGSFIFPVLTGLFDFTAWLIYWLQGIGIIVLFWGGMLVLQRMIHGRNKNKAT